MQTAHSKHSTQTAAKAIIYGRDKELVRGLPKVDAKLSMLSGRSSVRSGAWPRDGDPSEILPGESCGAGGVFRHSGDGGGFASSNMSGVDPRDGGRRVVYGSGVIGNSGFAE